VLETGKYNSPKGNGSTVGSLPFLPHFPGFSGIRGTIMSLRGTNYSFIPSGDSSLRLDRYISQ